jgi:hypothetical protein
VSVTSSQPRGSGITFSAAIWRKNGIAGYGREAASCSTADAGWWVLPVPSVDALT